MATSALLVFPLLGPFILLIHVTVQSSRFLFMSSSSLCVPGLTRNSVCVHGCDWFFEHSCKVSYLRQHIDVIFVETYKHSHVLSRLETNTSLVLFPCYLSLVITLYLLVCEYLCGPLFKHTICYHHWRSTHLTPNTPPPYVCTHKYIEQQQQPNHSPDNDDNADWHSAAQI